MADDYRPDSEKLTRMERLRRDDPQKYVKEAARAAVSQAVLNGALKKPDACSKCGDTPPYWCLHAHHTDYEKPLDVTWLCSACHGYVHRMERRENGGYPAGFTEREREIWPMVGDGMTDKQIAARIGLAASTVRVYVVSIAFKLQIPGGSQTRVLIAREWWKRKRYCVQSAGSVPSALAK